MKLRLRGILLTLATLLVFGTAARADVPPMSDAQRLIVCEHLLASALAESQFTLNPTSLSLTPDFYSTRSNLRRALQAFSSGYENFERVAFKVHDAHSNVYEGTAILHTRTRELRVLGFVSSHFMDTEEESRGYELVHEAERGTEFLVRLLPEDEPAAFPGTDPDPVTHFKLKPTHANPAR